jgi:hypothetical protein
VVDGQGEGARQRCAEQVSGVTVWCDLLQPREGSWLKEDAY